MLVKEKLCSTGEKIGALRLELLMAEASVILKPRGMGDNNLGHSVRKASSCSLVLGLNSTWSFDGKREAKINGS